MKSIAAGVLIDPDGMHAGPEGIHDQILYFLVVQGSGADDPDQRFPGVLEDLFGAEPLAASVGHVGVQAEVFSLLPGRF